MNVLRTTLRLVFPLLAGLAVGQKDLSTSAALAQTNKKPALCDLKSLPEDARTRLTEEFGSWRVQESTDLSKDAHERWKSEKPLACPGIAIGQFQSNKTRTYAALIVPVGQVDGGFKLLIFSQTADQRSYEVNVVAQADSGARNLFIHKVPISRFFDDSSRRKFQAHANDGILLIDSGENEYDAEVYFWTNGGYRHEPVDY